MATTVQLTIDCADPQALAQFWSTALHYVPEPIADRTAAIEAEVARLAAAGARVIGRVTHRDHFHVTMGDPEGNEFDLR